MAYASRTPVRAAALAAIAGLFCAGPAVPAEIGATKALKFATQGPITRAAFIPGDADSGRGSWPMTLGDARRYRLSPALPPPALPPPAPARYHVPRLPLVHLPPVPPLLSRPGEAPKTPAIKRLDHARSPFDSAWLHRSPGSDAGATLRLVRADTRAGSAPAHRASPLPRAPLSLPAAGLDPLAPAPGEAPAEEAEPPAPAFILPFEAGHVSSLFNQGRRHPAIDLAGRHGAPVFATANGQTVIFAGPRGGYGNAVITRDAEGREHLYGHLSAIGTRVGARLAQGERLGALGSTGYSTGPHVHYEVKDRRGKHIDPVTLLFPGRRIASGYAWSRGTLPRETVAAATPARRMR